MENLIEKSIAELNGYSFYIPDYQRGYRWTELEVKALLDDIWEFADSKDKDKGEFYCVQPLVVKKRADGSWEVIDGQQRLTTLHIILSFINLKVFKEIDEEFSIDYQTRPQSREFLNNMDENMAEENIDFSHMYNAYECINEWFPKNSAEFKDLGIKMQLAIRNQVKFIWYGVDQDTDSIEVFTRLNMGKIPLTNAELVKALLLSKNSISTQMANSEGQPLSKDELQFVQLEISNEWDMIEQYLNKPDFWSFLTNDKSEDYPTKIELLLNFVVPKRDKKDQFATFNHFLSMWKKESDLKKIWEDEIVATFHVLQEWFNDPKLYHYIGYLIATGAKNIKGILDEYKKAENKTDFEEDVIKGLVKNSLKDYDLNLLDYKKSYAKLSRVLLLFNVLSTMGVSGGLARYPFSRHKEEDWSLEHIHAQNSESIDTTDEWIVWLKEHLLLLSEVKGGDDELVVKTKAIIEKKSELTKNTFDEYSSAILKALSSPDDKDDELNVHGIENMALLSRNINSSLNDSAFSHKRKLVIKKDESGEYIPLCTKNVFLKYYNPEPTNFCYWDDGDRKNYVEKIRSVLTDFLPKQTNN